MSETPHVPLHGLVLTGGASSRMGRDKASLVYRDGPQWRVAANVLLACDAEPYWSCTARQAAEWGLTDRAILDLMPGHGPVSGLHAAFSRGDGVAWLVIGCDYPMLEAQDLQRLLDARSPTIDAVTYMSEATGEIEPMITLWEPAAQRTFLHAVADGEFSARRVLRTCALRVLTPRAPHLLDNRNSPVSLTDAAH